MQKNVSSKLSLSFFCCGRLFHIFFFLLFYTFHLPILQTSITRFYRHTFSISMAFSVRAASVQRAMPAIPAVPADASPIPALPVTGAPAVTRARPAERARPAVLADAAVSLADPV